MLITFETKAYANITMFGDVAKKLIKYMGHSGSIPGAILSEDLPQALKNLRSNVAAEMADEQNRESDADQDEDESYVSLDKRALPLVELLEAAIEQGADVMWDK